MRRNKRKRGDTLNVYDNNNKNENDEFSNLFNNKKQILINNNGNNDDNDITYELTTKTINNKNNNTKPQQQYSNNTKQQESHEATINHIVNNNSNDKETAKTTKIFRTRGRPNKTATQSIKTKTVNINNEKKNDLESHSQQPTTTNIIENYFKLNNDNNNNKHELQTTLDNTQNIQQQQQSSLSSSTTIIQTGSTRIQRIYNRTKLVNVSSSTTTLNNKILPPTTIESNIKNNKCLLSTINKKYLQRNKITTTNEINENINKNSKSNSTTTNSNSTTTMLNFVNTTNTVQKKSNNNSTLNKSPPFTLTTNNIINVNNNSNHLNSNNNCNIKTVNFNNNRNMLNTSSLSECSFYDENIHNNGTYIEEYYHQTNFLKQQQQHKSSQQLKQNEITLCDRINNVNWVGYNNNNNNNCCVDNHIPMPLINWASSIDLWKLMCNKDLFYVHDYQYLRKHCGIESQMRAILLDWLVEICYAYRLHRETFHLAVEYIDRFLTLIDNMKVDRLQLIGMTALFLAAKAEEIYPPKLREFASHMENYSENNEETITQFELFMLKSLNWQISPVTANSWVNIYLQINKLNNDTSSTSTSSLSSNNVYSTTRMLLPNYSKIDYLKAITLIDLCLFDIDSLKFKYSQLAASALYHMCIKNNYEFQLTTGYKLVDLDSCIEWMQPYADCIKDIENDIQIKYFSNIDTDDAHNIQLYYQYLDLLKKAQSRKTPSKFTPLNASNEYSNLLTPPDSNKKNNNSQKK